MQGTPKNPQPEAPPPEWLKSLAEKRKQISYGLFVACAAAAGYALYIFLRGSVDLPWGIYLVFLALTLLVTGAWQSIRAPGDLNPEEQTRLAILTAGGLIGLFTTVVLGLGLAWTWRIHLLGGWKVWQEGEMWRIWVLLLVFVGGLAIMFISLQLARTQARTSVVQRRLLYGFNAVLSSLLLFAILVIFNVLLVLPIEPFRTINTPYDWTSRSIYSLSPKSTNILKKLDQPVKAYLILRQSDRTSQSIYRWVEALMKNAQGASGYFQYEYLSPDRHMTRVQELANEYKFGDQSQGLLVVYGSGATRSDQFIKLSDLVETTQASQSRQGVFKGEAALIGALEFMMENKTRPKIYFTQGNGEPSLRDGNPRSPGLGQLRQRLEDRGYYEVRGLQLSLDEKVKPEAFDMEVSKQVPDDAAVVVVIRPQTMPAHALEALREYTQKKNGKLIVMLGMLRDPKNRAEMRRTGMEELLAAYNVQVGNEVILHDPRVDNLPSALVTAVTNPDEGVQSRLPIAGAFQGVEFHLELPRPVQSSPAGRPGGPSVDVLLEVPHRLGPWLQPDLDRIDDGYFVALLKSGQLSSRLSPRAVPVAVAVSEGDSALPPDKFHAHLPRGAEKPRMLVFGDGDWVTNPYLISISGLNYDLFASSLAWLRERKEAIGIEAKKSDVYTWKANEAAEGKMVLFPGLFALITIVGLGAGVWIVRRR